jgi:hypothetical protein
MPVKPGSSLGGSGNTGEAFAPADSAAKRKQRSCAIRARCARLKTTPRTPSLDDYRQADRHRQCGAYGLPRRFMRSSAAALIALWFFSRESVRDCHFRLIRGELSAP